MKWVFENKFILCGRLSIFIRELPIAKTIAYSVKLIRCVRTLFYIYIFFKKKKHNPLYRH